MTAFFPPGPPSLSARRAWIEIVLVRGGGFRPRVALRKESVDRNRQEPATVQRLMQSLSARRAWIEIITQRATPPTS